MKNKISVLVLGLMTAFFLLGCASSGTKIDRANVDQIKKGVTTRNDLEKMFGPPMNVGLMGDGRRSLIFQFTEAQIKGTSFIPYAGPFMGGRTMRMQTLQVILDQNNIVQDFEFSDQSRDLQQEGFKAKETVTNTSESKK